MLLPLCRYGTYGNIVELSQTAARAPNAAKRYTLIKDEAVLVFLLQFHLCTQ